MSSRTGSPKSRRLDSDSESVQSKKSTASSKKEATVLKSRKSVKDDASSVGSRRSAGQADAQSMASKAATVFKQAGDSRGWLTAMTYHAKRGSGALVPDGKYPGVLTVAKHLELVGQVLQTTSRDGYKFRATGSEEEQRRKKGACKKMNKSIPVLLAIVKKAVRCLELVADSKFKQASAIFPVDKTAFLEWFLGDLTDAVDLRIAKLVSSKDTLVADAAKKRFAGTFPDIACVGDEKGGFKTPAVGKIIPLADNTKALEVLPKVLKHLRSEAGLERLKAKIVASISVTHKVKGVETTNSPSDAAVERIAAVYLDAFEASIAAVREGVSTKHNHELLLQGTGLLLVPEGEAPIGANGKPQYALRPMKFSVKGFSEFVPKDDHKFLAIRQRLNKELFASDKSVKATRNVPSSIMAQALANLVGKK